MSNMYYFPRHLVEEAKFRADLLSRWDLSDVLTIALRNTPEDEPVAIPAYRVETHQCKLFHKAREKRKRQQGI